MRLRGAGVAAVVAAAACVLAPAAHADIIAATDVINTALNRDIALIDTATGGHLGLPAGINTDAQEIHPSITPDGKRLVFERRDSAGVTHIIVADLSTGQQAELFNAFETGQYQPQTPVITPDGKKVITGAEDQQASGQSLFVPTWTETDISSFPGGPFPHTIRQQPNLPVPETGRTLDPTFEPAIGIPGVGTTAVAWHRDGVPRDGILYSNSGKLTGVFDNGFSLSYPTVSKAAGVLLYDGRSVTDQYTVDLFYRTLLGDGAPSSSSFQLPGVNGSGFADLDPAFTVDGRYIVYRRQVTTHPGGGTQAGNVHIFVYDTSTGSLLNPNGLDLGYGDLVGFNGSSGGLSVYEKFTLKSTTFINSTGGALLAFRLNNQAGVGILVERIVGHHKLFGQRVPTLRKVGKVPFGQFRHGRHRVRWNLRVHGRKLRPGRYLVIPRALTRKGVVRELGKPHALRVR